MEYNKIMGKTLLPILGVFLTLSLFLAPAIASAHVGVPSQLVPCTNDCNVCHLYNLAHNIIDLLLWGIATPLLVVALLAAGFFWLTSAGSEEKITKGKSILFSAVVGFVIAFGAWVIINTIMTTLVFKNPIDNNSAWNNTDFCSQSPFDGGAGVGIGRTGTGGTRTSGTGTGTGGTAQGAKLGEQAARNFLAQNGISVNNNTPCPVGTTFQQYRATTGQGCTTLEGINQKTLDAVAAFRNACVQYNAACTVQITGGTELGHSTTGTTHASGSKVDIAATSITATFVQSLQPAGTRGDGAALYRCPAGLICAAEPGHFDVSI